MMEKSQRAYDEFLEETKRELHRRVANGELSKEEIDRLKSGEMFGEELDKDPHLRYVAS